MKFLLEYQLPDTPNRPGILNSNIMADDGSFYDPLNTNGYLPLAVFDTDAIQADEHSTEVYRLLCDWLHVARPDYNTAKRRAEHVRDQLKKLNR